MQFFTAHGLMSMSGALLTALIFARCGALFMRHGYEYALDTPEKILAFYCGSRWEKAASAAMQLLLYACYVVMIAGAGAALSEYFGASARLGRVLMTLLTLVTVLAELSGLADILGRLGIVLIGFSLLIGILSFVRDSSGLRDVPALLAETELTRSGRSWLTAAILYPGYNALFVLTLSCRLGAAAESRKEALAGGALGGALFGFTVFVMDLALMCNLQAVGGRAVPTLALAERIHPALSSALAAVIFLEIYTTAVPLLWSLVRPLAEDGSNGFFLVAAGLSGAGLILGSADFTKLVSILYPISGFVGTLLLLLAVHRDRQLRRQPH